MGDLSGHEKEVNYRFTEAYELIRSARLVKGKSDFSEKIGMHSSYYSKFEKFERAIPDYILDNLSQVFGINKTWLLTGEGEVSKIEPEKPKKKEDADSDSPKRFVPKNKASTMAPSWESQFSKNAGAPSVKPNMELFSRWLYSMNKSALASPPMMEAEIKHLMEENERLNKEVERLNKELIESQKAIIELLKKK